MLRERVSYGKELLEAGRIILMMNWRKYLMSGLKTKLRVFKLTSNGSEIDIDLIFFDYLRAEHSLFLKMKINGHK